MMDRRTKQIVDLFCATSDGTPDELQRCIARGHPWDEPLPGAPSNTIPINIAAQYQRFDNLAILANKALQEGRPELLESPDLKGRSPSYLAVQKGSPECLGVMAKAGANLHRACPHVWQLPGEIHLVDPDTSDDSIVIVHHALNQTVMSFVTQTCMGCNKNATETGVAQLKRCGQCQIAFVCSAECQRETWKLHKKVCKRIRKGSDLLIFGENMPQQAKSDQSGFLPFDPPIDNDLELDDEEDEADYYDATIQWEYYDLESASWLPYPKYINHSIESMQELGMSGRYMYRPGDKNAEGVQERDMPVTARSNPPRGVASNHIYFCHMIDHQVYSGCGRKIRRNVLT